MAKPTLLSTANEFERLLMEPIPFRQRGLVAVYELPLPLRLPGDERGWTHECDFDIPPYFTDTIWFTAIEKIGKSNFFVFRVGHYESIEMEFKSLKDVREALWSVFELKKCKDPTFLQERLKVLNCVLTYLGETRKFEWPLTPGNCWDVPLKTEALFALSAEMLHYYTLPSVLRQLSRWTLDKKTEGADQLVHKTKNIAAAFEKTVASFNFSNTLF